MKSFQKVFALVFLLAATFGFAQAQRGGWKADPGQRAAQQTASMKEKLALSDAQAEKVGEINLRFANKKKEAKAEHKDGDKAAMMQTMKTLRQQQETELKAVLSEEQWGQWEKLKEEKRAQKGHKKGHKGKVKGKDKQY